VATCGHSLLPLGGFLLCLTATTVSNQVAPSFLLLSLLLSPPVRCADPLKKHHTPHTQALSADGLTALNGLAQRQVIRKVVARAGLRPSDVDFVEAHGTGTQLGDPIEMGTLSAVLGPCKPLVVGGGEGGCRGSGKRAGGCGLNKVLLAFERGAIPGQGELLQRTNSLVDLSAVPTLFPRGNA